MKRLEEQIQEVGGLVRFEPDEDYVEWALSSMRRKQRRRATTRWVASALVFVGAVVGVGALGQRVLKVRAANIMLAQSSKTATPPTNAPSGTLEFADGSRVLPVREDTEMRLVEVGPAQVTVDLLSGGSEFRIKHRPNRLFRVTAGDLSVEVLGTVFRVEREDRRTGVTVSSGRVKVTFGGETAILSDGQERWFSPGAPAIAATAVQPEPPEPARNREQARKTKGIWRALAKQRDYHRAYESLHATSVEDVRDDAQDLLLAADVARLSGHPEEAVPYLRRVTRSFPRDPRASLAAFTLGRVLLDELDRPREAARAFLDARERDPGSPLAEDALVRELEAWTKAGETVRAQAAAATYQRLYPNGKRLIDF